MEELYHRPIDFHACEMRITEADTRCEVGFVIARDLQVIDVDVGQGLCKWALFGAAGLTFCPQSSSQLPRHAHWIAPSASARICCRRSMNASLATKASAIMLSVMSISAQPMLFNSLMPI